MIHFCCSEPEFHRQEDTATSEGEDRRRSHGAVAYLALGRGWARGFGCVDACCLNDARPAAKKSYCSQFTSTVICYRLTRVGAKSLTTRQG
jgi:hypothetical protein